jgi:hypothetical protein
VATIAGLLAEDVTVQEVLQHCPQLTAQDVQACQGPTRPAATSGRAMPPPTTRNDMRLARGLAEIAWAGFIAGRSG